MQMQTETQNNDLNKTLIDKEKISFLDFKRSTSTSDFPNQFSDYVTSHGDAYYWARGGFHIVTKAKEAQKILMRPEFSADRSSFFISRMPNLELRLIGDFFQTISKMMVMSDGKLHTQRRRMANVGLSDEFIDGFRTIIEEIVEKAIEAGTKDGKLEFAQSVARVIPSQVLATVFGIPESDRDFFIDCSSKMTAFFGGAVEYTNEVGIEVNVAAKSIAGYFKKLIESRRQSPQNDFFTGMLKAQEELGLEDDELVSQAVMMLVAGQVTTTDQMCNNFYLLLSNEAIRNELHQAPEKLTAALEEFNRFDPAVTFLFRVCRKECSVGQNEYKPGDTVFISNHAVNRDESIFSSPMELKLDRKLNPHFAYGYGPHYCLGARLARLQMEILFSKLVKDYPEIKLMESRPAVRDHYSLSFSGFSEIWVELGPTKDS